MKKYRIGVLSILCIVAVNALPTIRLKMQKSVSPDGTVYPGYVQNGWDYVVLDSPARGYENYTYRNMIQELHQHREAFYFAAVTFKDASRNFHRWYVPAHIALRDLHWEEEHMPGHDALNLIPNGCEHVGTTLLKFPWDLTILDRGLYQVAQIGRYHALSSQVYDGNRLPDAQRDLYLVAAFNSLPPSVYERYRDPLDQGDNVEPYDVRDDFDGNEE